MFAKKGTSNWGYVRFTPEHWAFQAHSLTGRQGLVVEVSPTWKHLGTIDYVQANAQRMLMVDSSLQIFRSATLREVSEHLLTLANLTTLYCPWTVLILTAPSIVQITTVYHRIEPQSACITADTHTSCFASTDTLRAWNFTIGSQTFGKVMELKAVTLWNDVFDSGLRLPRLQFDDLESMLQATSLSTTRSGRNFWKGSFLH